MTHAADGIEDGQTPVPGVEKMAFCKIGDDGEDINEEDLFEIDLETLNGIPPPTYCESHPNAAGITLLANCLLPAVEVSGAVPITSDLETTLETLRRRDDVGVLPLVWGFHLIECRMFREMMNAKFRGNKSPLHYE